jgi:hypothetical protein
LGEHHSSTSVGYAKTVVIRGVLLIA